MYRSVSRVGSEPESIISRLKFYVLARRVSPSILDKVLGKPTLDSDSRPVVNGPGAGLGLRLGS